MTSPLPSASTMLPDEQTALLTRVRDAAYADGVMDASVDCVAQLYMMRRQDVLYGCAACVMTGLWTWSHCCAMHTSAAAPAPAPAPVNVCSVHSTPRLCIRGSGTVTRPRVRLVQRYEWRREVQRQQRQCCVVGSGTCWPPPSCTQAERDVRVLRGGGRECAALLDELQSVHRAVRQLRTQLRVFAACACACALLAAWQGSACMYRCDGDDASVRSRT